MKQLTRNESVLLKILTDVYNESIMYGNYSKSMSKTLKENKIPYYATISTVLNENNLTEVIGLGPNKRTKWIGIKPTYLTAKKCFELSYKKMSWNTNKIKRQNKINIRTEEIVVNRETINKKSPKFTKRDDFINMFDNIVSENKEANLKTVELENSLIKANKDKEKLNVIISEYKEKHLESYTTSFLWGLIKIKTKLNYSK